MTKSSSKSQRAADIASYESEIYYSPRYDDGKHEYRHVVLPKQLAKYVIPNRTMTEDEWRSIGVRQSPGWTHYMIHAPEPHILLFRRDIDPVPLTESAGGMAF